MADEKPESAQSAPQLVWAGADETRYLTLSPAGAPTPDSADDSTGYTPPSEQARHLARTVVATLVNRMAAEARRLGGYLTMRDIDRLTDEFNDTTKELQQVFQNSFDQYVRARERAAVDHARQFPFDRIIVHTFAHLFEPERIADDAEHAVTRAVLPGFFIALDKMLGEEVIADFQARAGAIVERLSPNSERDVDWHQVYADPEADNIRLDALTGMAPYFTEFERRRAWFLRLVNGAVPPGVDWELTDWGFFNMLESLFAPLRTALDRHRAEMEQRFGGVPCFNMDKVLERLEKEGRREA